MESLGRIEQKVDGLVPTITRQRIDHEALEVRTRVLENWRWYLVGTISLIGVIIGFVLKAGL